MLYSMFFFAIFVVSTGVFETLVTFLSFTGSSDVHHLQTTTQSPSDTLFPPSRHDHLWNNNAFGAAFTNKSRSDSAYTKDYAWWKENEENCLETCQKVTREDHGSFEDEHLDGFSNGLTNASTGVVIGGSGSGVVMICFCVLIYFLYRLLRSPPRIEPMPDRKTEAFIIPLHSRNAARTEPDVIYVREAEAVANSNGAPCPGCRNVCSSPHLAWSEPEFPMEECICMSAPPPYS